MNKFASIHTAYSIPHVYMNCAWQLSNYVTKNAKYVVSNLLTKTTHTGHKILLWLLDMPQCNNFCYSTDVNVKPVYHIDNNYMMQIWKSWSNEQCKTRDY